VWQYGFGIHDELFIRGDVPMTKQEVRVISLSKMRLKRDNIIWDIGAGTGSVSVEAAVYCKQGKVFAVEKNIKALGLLEKNREVFELENLEIISGEAPEAIRGLPKPQRIFIGGTGGKTQEVLNAAISNLDHDGIIVANAITMETVCEVQAFFKDILWDLDITLVNIAVSRKAGEKTLMLAHNPVYILAANRPTDNKTGECIL
jgi:cobalt-precorrin-6B (C15)-methyltransferase